MKKWLSMLLTLCMLFTCAAATENETLIVLGEDAITVNGEAISEDVGAVYLARQVETHEDVPKALEGVENRVVTITEAGVYRITGAAGDTQIAVKAGKNDEVRLILDGADITCSTAPAIAIYSAADPKTPGEYGVTIELAQDSENVIAGSHTVGEDDEIEFDGAIDSLVSLGFEGTGSLTVDADNEGIEVQYGHMTINGGRFSIQACDDPLNVSQDGVGVLTINDGYVYSSVKPVAGGEGDGIDSNGYIVFNGGTAINLAHPSSQDGGIDSDMGSSINGGVIVGAGNMYDPIDANSQQLFMMLEFGEATNDLIVVTDEQDVPVFAYDFPHDYMYIAFSTPELKENATYRVYLGGEITGEETDGLYTNITSYVPGTRLQHGAGNAQQRMPMGGMSMGEMPENRGAAPEMPQGMGDMQPGQPVGFNPNPMMNAFESLDLNEVLKDADLNALLSGKDLNGLLTGFSLSDLLTDEQIKEIFGDADPAMLDAFSGRGRMGDGFGGMGGFGGPRGMQSSAEFATADFVLTRETTGFTNVTAAK